MKREFWRYFDFWLFGSVLILCIFGIAMINSATAGNAVLAPLVNSQIIYVTLGLGVILVTAVIDYHYWASLTRIMYFGTIILLIVIFILGQAVFGSARWIKTGLVNIQPSELAKIVMVIVLADYFARAKDAKHDLGWILRSLALTFGVVIWILLQPNLSTSIVMMVIWFSLIWVSGLPPKYLVFLLTLVVVGISIFLVLIAIGIKIPFVQDYQVARIVNFLFPDPAARHGNSYNVEQALITIGSGGWFGQGYAHSTQVQLRYLKVRHTDFIFSAMAAEFGFIGTVIVIGMLVFIILRCLRAARLASDPFGSLIAYGIATLLFFQTSVNIGVNLNVIPVTGLTLPFISYGGSSLLSLVLGIGLVESVIARHRPLEF
jgi:rod shape determining protein RodA